MKQHIIIILCTILLVPGNLALTAQQATQQPAADAARIPADQLDSLVAPIALYPDPLLSQTLVASTYPLEIIQLQQWLDEIKDSIRRRWSMPFRNSPGIQAFRPWLRFPTW